MPDTQPLPSPGEIAAMDGPELDALAARAMGECFADLPDMLGRGFWSPSAVADDALELAEKVSIDQGYLVGRIARNDKNISGPFIVRIDPGVYIRAQTFQLALTRAVVTIWAEREREAQR